MVSFFQFLLLNVKTMHFLIFSQKLHRNVKITTSTTNMPTLNKFEQTVTEKSWSQVYPFKPQYGCRCHGNRDPGAIYFAWKCTASAGYTIWPMDVNCRKSPEPFQCPLYSYLLHSTQVKFNFDFNFNSFKNGHRSSWGSNSLVVQWTSDSLIAINLAQSLWQGNGHLLHWEVSPSNLLTFLWFSYLNTFSLIYSGPSPGLPVRGFYSNQLLRSGVSEVSGTSHSVDTPPCSSIFQTRRAAKLFDKP